MKFIDELLKTVPPTTEQEVERAKTRFNQSIRQALRRETGVGLAYKIDDDKRDSINIPVKVVPGYPEALRRVDIAPDARLAAIISKWRRDIEVMRDVLRVANYQLIPAINNSEFTEAVTEDERKSIIDAEKLAERLLSKAGQFDIVKWILEIDEDVLGAYFYNGHPVYIELYWAVIGFVAQSLGVAVEDLTVVVLAHELAHAYTHLGADIDGHRWNTLSFKKSELALKEGLAQYYTSRVCNRLEYQVPKSLEAYEELLKHQPDDYKSHITWLSRHSPEEVRFALLLMRRAGDGKLTTFNDSLLKVQKGLTSFNPDR
jgi:hypothetical protein